MYKYHKIKPPYIRGTDGKLVKDEYINDSLKLLEEHNWIATEKIDGTNIGIYWDGYDLHLQGQTEKSIIPKRLLEMLENKFVNERVKNIFEQEFEEKEVVLFGEGYGENIQINGYTPCGTDFIAFDLYFPNTDTYATREELEDFCIKIDIEIVPIVWFKPLYEIIDDISEGRIMESLIGSRDMEGVVAVPEGDFRDRKGNRIITKIKYKDFRKE